MGNTSGSIDRLEDSFRLIKQDPRAGLWAIIVSVALGVFLAAISTAILRIYTLSRFRFSPSPNVKAVAILSLMIFGVLGVVQAIISVFRLFNFEDYTVIGEEFCPFVVLIAFGFLSKPDLAKLRNEK